MQVESDLGDAQAEGRPVDSSVGLIGSFLPDLIGAVVLLAILRLFSRGRVTV